MALTDEKSLKNLFKKNEFNTIPHCMTIFFLDHLDEVISKLGDCYGLQICKMVLYLNNINQKALSLSQKVVIKLSLKSNKRRKLRYMVLTERVVLCIHYYKFLLKSHYVD